MMVSPDDYELLARLQADELTATERAQLEARLAVEPALREASEHLRRLDGLVAELPRTRLSPPDVARLVEAALLARKRRWWPAIAVAASLAALALGWGLTSAEVATATVTSEVAIIDGRNQVAGASVTNPGRVLTAETGGITLRLDARRRALVGPNSSVQVDRGALRLERGVLVGQGEGLRVAIGARQFTISGEALLSTEPLPPELRVTPYLTPEQLMTNARRFSAGTIILAGAAALYVLQGSVSVEADGTPTVVQAPGRWSATDARQTAATGAPAGTHAAEAGATGAGSAAADGAFEVRVTAAGKPVAKAGVTLYARGDRSLSTGRWAWLHAHTASTDGEGVAVVPAAEGPHFVAVRAPGFAPAVLEAHRAQHEKRTRLEVWLTTGHEVSGSTEEASTQRPVVPAAVTLAPFRGPLSEAKVVDVDAQGRFVAKGLTAGEWEVTAEAPGVGRLRERIRVPRAQPLKLVFRPQGFVEGFVLLPDGGPAVGAAVSLVGEELAQVQASASGSFSVEAAAGVWQAQARLGELVGRAPGEVIVHSGETTSVGRLVLQAAATLRGRVLAGDAGVEGAVVEVSPHKGEGQLAQGTTDGLGRYSIPLVAGVYDVGASAAGRPSAEVLGLHVALETTLDLLLPAPATIRGVVVDTKGALMSGVVVEALETPVASRKVRSADGKFLFEGVNPGRWNLRARDEHDRLLAATLSLVEPGQTTEVKLVVEPRARVDGVIEWKCPGTRRPVGVEFHARLDSVPPLQVTGATFTVDLVPGAYLVRAMTQDEACGAIAELELEGEQQGLRLVMVPQEAQLEVTVLEPDGHPSSGALVTVVDAQSPSTMFDLGKTREDGVMRLTKWRDGPPTRPIQVVASNGGRSARSAPFSAARRRMAVQLEPAGALELTLEGLTQGTAAKVELVAVPSFSFQDEVTTTSPRLALETVPPGRLHVTVRAGTQAAEGEVAIAPGERARLSLRLEAAGSVVGRLMTKKGAPRGGWIGLSSLEGSETSEAVQVDGTGRFVLEPVVPGTYLLILRPEGTKKQVVVKPGQATNVGDFVVPPGTWSLH